MDYEKAKAITAEYAPSLIVDPYNEALPDLFAVRARVGGHPFSINLSHVDPSTLQPIEAREATPEIPSAEATDDHPAIPYQPARPAVAAKSVAEQKEEQERKHLTLALDAARTALGVA